MALLGFQKFDQKPKTEDQNKKEADQFPLSQEKRAGEAEAPKEAKDEKIKKGLIDLDRMAWDRQAVVYWVAKNDRPREIARRPEDFLIDEISHPNETGRQRGGDGDEVEESKAGKLWL